MGKDSKINWTTHSWNLVWGCQRVSAGCEKCYAESLSKRYGKTLWGPKAPRQTMSENYWKQPLKWDATAAKNGVRERVFCSSMADVFEDHPTNNAERPKLWALIRATPNLDWLLLTKRPENIAAMLPEDWGDGYANVWLGATTENQTAADKRAPILCSIPARVRFLSVEPQLDHVDLSLWLTMHIDELGNYRSGGGIHWIICGGESGPGARPFDLRWARNLLGQCREAGVAFWMKQLGTNPIGYNGSAPYVTVHKKGEDIEEFPEDLRVRELPETGLPTS